MSDIVSLAVGIAAHRRINSIKSDMRAQKLNLEDNLYELEGILAKLSANSDTRRLPVRIGRSWSKDGGWVYSVEAK